MPPVPCVKISFLLMFKSSRGKLFFAIIVFFASACNFSRTGETNTNNATPSAANELVTEIPFSTKEPEIYQTDIIITAGETERKIFTARSGTRRLTVFNRGEKDEIERLELDGGFLSLVNRAAGIYAGSTGEGAATSDETFNDFLTTEWLNQKTPAAFENLGAENNLTKFRVKLGDAGNLNSEVLIYVDENLKLPVRQEFYSIEDGQKILSFSVELKNFKPEATEDFFQIPKDLRYVSMKEFQEIIRQERNEK